MQTAQQILGGLGARRLFRGQRARGRSRAGADAGELALEHGVDQQRRPEQHAAEVSHTSTNSAGNLRAHDHSACKQKTPVEDTCSSARTFAKVEDMQQEAARTVH
jgi:hypothetical protein